MRVANLAMLGGSLRVYVEAATPPTMVFSLHQVLAAARQLGLWIERSADDSHVLIKNYGVRMITPSPRLVDRQGIEEQLRQALPFDPNEFTSVQVEVKGVWLNPIPLINTKEGYLSFETEIRGFHSGEREHAPAAWKEPREDVALLVGVWLGSFNQVLDFPEPVVEVWKDRSLLPVVRSGDCGSLGQIDKLYFASELPSETPASALNYLGLRR